MGAWRGCRFCATARVWSPIVEEDEREDDDDEDMAGA
jgi:hypothetical protein